MRILVDEMPKHCVNCKYCGYNYYDEIYICKKDLKPCDLAGKQCRHHKKYALIKDDCK